MLIFCKLFYYMYYLPMCKGSALHLENFESSLPKDALCKVWLKLSQWLLSRWWQVYKNNQNTQWTKLTWAWIETYKNNFVGPSRDLLLIIKKRVWATKAAIKILHTGNTWTVDLKGWICWPSLRRFAVTFVPVVTKSG